MEADNLTLKEQFILLALEDNEGTLIHDSIPFQVGLAGAIIYEMVKEHIFDIDEHHLYLNSNIDTSDNCHLMVINQYKKHKHTPLVKTILEEIWAEADYLRKCIVETLVNKGVLTVKKKKILWLFTVKRYPTLNEIPEKQLRLHLKSLIDNNAIPNDDEFILIKLVTQCDLNEEVFGSKYISLVNDYINHVNSVSGAVSEVSQSIADLEKSLFDAITASTLSVVISGN
jgi:golgi phosphoprotein 3